MRARSAETSTRPKPSAVSVCGSGASTDPDARRATELSVRAALARLAGRSPSLGFLFVTPDHDLSDVLATARSLTPRTDFVACSTAGELTEQGLTHGGIACMLAAWGSAAHSLRFAAEMGDDGAGLSERLTRGFADQIAIHAAAGRSQSTTLLFGDGLSPTFEKLVEQMRRTTSPTQQIVGAGAADEGKLVSTKIGANDRELPGGAVAIHIFSRQRWGVGVEHGVERMTGPMTVTRARGNVVHEINGIPALEVYRRYAAQHGGSLEGDQRRQFLIENELGVLLFDDLVRVRAPIRVQDQALFFAGEVPEGSSVCIVRSEPAKMFAAAKQAARTARQNLSGARAAGVLVFSCICRATRLGERYADEIECVREVFPDLPIVGFSSYGEVARTDAKLDGYHNSTLVVAAIPE